MSKARLSWPLLLFSVLLLGTADVLRADEGEEEAPAAAPAYQPRELAPSWRDQAERSLQRRDLLEAVVLYRRWLLADPRDDGSWYNLACCYALLGERPKALEAFEAAVDAGWTDADWPREDPDLESLRAEARFTAALERASSKASGEGPASFVRHYVTYRTLGTYVALLPPDYETSEAAYPLVVILHGNGSTEMKHGRIADRVGREGVIYVVPRAPHPNLGVFLQMREPGWTWRPQDADDEATDPFDPAALYVDSVLAAVDDARKRYRVRGERFCVFGHSMGGFFANVTAILHPDRVAAYFAYAGGLPEEYHDGAWAEGLKANDVKAVHVHGKADSVVDPSLSEKAHEVMSAAGVDSTLHLVEGVGHGVAPEVAELLAGWVDDVVRPVPQAEGMPR